MRPLGSVLSSESPVTLAREALWRARKRWKRKHALRLLERESQVSFRSVGYFRPSLAAAGLSEAGRRALLGASNLLLQGRFPFLGYETANLGLAPAWNCDFVSGKQWPQVDSALIKIIRHDGSDVKVPWELSRLQFLPVLAKAYVISKDESYRECVKVLLDHWIDDNPVGVGVNWAIAMEVALRAISVCLSLDLLSPFRQDEQHWVRKVTDCLWKHLWYIEAHSEFSYFTRSNHYLSNIVGLLCLATFLEGPGMIRSRLHYQKLVEQEIFCQTYEDGGDFEASTGYHVLVTQMFTCGLFLAKAAGARSGAGFIERLRKMYQFAAEVAGATGNAPHVGDCDDGRVELLVDDLQQMLEVPLPERHSLTISNFLGIGSALFGDFEASAFDDAQWYGINAPKAPPFKRVAQSRSAASVALFPHSGVAVGRNGKLQLLFFAMPNGVRGKGSHTHNDKLSFVLRVNGQEMFSDSGTGHYTRDGSIRNLFRSTGVHNTIVVDGTEQNRIVTDLNRLFYIGNDAQVTPIQWDSVPGGISFEASHSGYENLDVFHSRRLEIRSSTFIIKDLLSGTGEHTFELNFRIPPPVTVATGQRSGNTVSCRFTGTSPAFMRISAPVTLELTLAPAPMSRSYGSFFSALCATVRGRSRMPVQIITEFILENGE